MRTGIEPPRTAVPTSVLAAALTYGSMCSVSKEPVTRVTMDNIFLILDFHYVKFIVSLCFFTFPSLFLVFVSSGCRCPEGQLLQDGRCVPVTECRCGIPSGNGTLEFLPEEEFTVDCNTW